MASKKSFKENISPAMQFISEPAAEADKQGDGTLTEATPPTNPPQQPAPMGKPPEGYKINPIYIETKSKRLQLLVQPSLLERIRTQAKASGTSVNDYVHTLLEQATREEQ